MTLPSSVLPRPARQGEAPGPATTHQGPSPVLALLALVAGLLGVVAVVGGDARWLVAAGAEIVGRGELPDHVPYALAPSSGWHNVPALAEVLAFAANPVGPNGLLVLHMGAVLGGLLVLDRDAAAGGARRSSSAVLLAVAVLGAFTTLFVVRLQLFSLLLFPVLVALLRSDARRPSRQVWWVPVLLAVWGNLHGAVLLGLAVTLTYLVFSRVRTSWNTPVAVSLASCAALLVTPAGLDTVDYYVGIADNEAARLHVGLWARLSLGNPFDVILLLCAVVLVALFVRARPALWEYVAALGLAVAVALAARNGVWLLMFLTPVAARGLPGLTWRHGRVLTAVTTAVALVLGIVAVVRGPAAFGASPRLVALTVDVSARCAVYAQDVFGEQVVQAGGRVWITNPIDTFTPEDQRRFIGWMQSGHLDLVPTSVEALLVAPGGAPDDELRRSTGHEVAAQDETAVLYVRPEACAVRGR